MEKLIHILMSIVGPLTCFVGGTTAFFAAKSLISDIQYVLLLSGISAFGVGLMMTFMAITHAKKKS